MDEVEQYKISSQKALNWLIKKLNQDGSYKLDNQDLACYYKSPYLFYISGKLEEANLCLNYIQQRFMQDNGDFVTSEGNKSKNVALEEYWAYINAWIAIAAQKIGRFDIAYPAYRYLQSFYERDRNIFLTHNPNLERDNVTDVLTASHLGLTALYFGELETAKIAGSLLQKFVSLQPTLETNFYLRMGKEEKIITEFPEEASIFFTINSTKPFQAYFMIGYPIAFLGKLYQTTKDELYINLAKQYLDYVLTCDGSMYQFYLSHKVAWGASIVAKVTKEEKYLKLVNKIANYLVNLQEEDGCWLKDEPTFNSYDQTAEIAIWLREISVELSLL